MKNKRIITALAIIAGSVVAHFCMDIYKIGIKDGRANAHQSALIRSK